MTSTCNGQVKSVTPVAERVRAGLDRDSARFSSVKSQAL